MSVWRTNNFFYNILYIMELQVCGRICFCARNNFQAHGTATSGLNDFVVGKMVE